MDNRQIGSENARIAIGTDGAENYAFIEHVENEKEGLRYFYYIWMSRFFIFVACVSLLVMISSSLALFSLAPMVRVEPFLIIKQDSSEGIVRNEPITETMASKEKLMKTFIKQYVIYRNTVINDQSEMKSRWWYGGIVSFMSSLEVYEPFEETVHKGWVDMINQVLVREVEIISVNRQGGAKSPIWKVDFKTYDLYNDSNGQAVLRTRYWTASLSARFIKERQFFGRRLLNPLGFTVTRYSQTEVDIL